MRNESQRPGTGLSRATIFLLAALALPLFACGQLAMSGTAETETTTHTTSTDVGEGSGQLRGSMTDHFKRDEGNSQTDDDLGSAYELEIHPGGRDEILVTYKKKLKENADEDWAVALMGGFIFASEHADKNDTLAVKLIFLDGHSETYFISNADYLAYMNGDIDLDTFLDLIRVDRGEATIEDDDKDKDTKVGDQSIGESVEELYEGAVRITTGDEGKKSLKSIFE